MEKYVGNYKDYTKLTLPRVTTLVKPSKIRNLRCRNANLTFLSIHRNLHNDIKCGNTKCCMKCLRLDVFLDPIKLRVTSRTNLVHILAMLRGCLHCLLPIHIRLLLNDLFIDKTRFPCASILILWNSFIFRPLTINFAQILFGKI